MSVEGSRELDERCPLIQYDERGGIIGWGKPNGKTWTLVPGTANFVRIDMWAVWYLKVWQRTDLYAFTDDAEVWQRTDQYAFTDDGEVSDWQVASCVVKAL